MNTPTWTVSNDKHTIVVDHVSGIFYERQLLRWNEIGRVNFELINAPHWPDEECEINESFHVARND